MVIQERKSVCTSPLGFHKVSLTTVKAENHTMELFACVGRGVVCSGGCSCSITGQPCRAGGGHVWGRRANRIKERAEGDRYLQSGKEEINPQQLRRAGLARLQLQCGEQ